MNQSENESENVLQMLFAEAFEIKDARERAAFLSGACGTDSALRQEVDDLLQAAEAVGRFLPDKPDSTGAGFALREFAGTLESGDVMAVAPLTEQPGDYIGRYKLLEKIGEGGCGVVYMAEQEQPVRRHVALKVIKLGMDTKSVIGRFEAERQALAVMDHPSIAKVFDAGATDTGRPFFVMELVRGTRITDYCEQNEFSVRQRLELFIQVCQAVQHAHQKGIIHRDLKPSNILIAMNDSVAVPKVIDFGIAKATEGRLTDQTLFTTFEQFLGTPAYMSPEQAAMTSQDIDTRSDIYSLGVLLYELLTGNTPFDTKEVLALGVDELRRTIRETEPVRPSTRLTRELVAARKVGRDSPCAPPSNGTSSTDGADEVTRPTPKSAIRNPQSAIDPDLDWIVMKCLEKDRARRYETANGLAADLKRHLNNEPVVARPPSRIYEFQKTVQRHRFGFAAGLAIITALAAGVLVSTLEALRARQAERKQAQLQHRAEQETARAREAEADTKEKLWRAYLAETQAGRWSRRPGRRLNGLELLKSAAEIRPSLELRNEAIACMALADLRVIKEWQAHPLGGGSVAFDGQYERYAYADASNTVHVCRVDDATEVSQFSGFEPQIMGMNFSPDDRLLVVVFGKRFERVQVLDLNSKTVVLDDTGPPVRNAEFSADSRLLALACKEPRSNWPVRIFDVVARKEIGSFSHGSLPYDLRFHPKDINRLLTTDSTPVVRIWDWPTAKVVQTLNHPNGVLRVAWCPDGEIVAAGCADHKVHLWETATGREFATLTGHESVPVNISFSADGEFLATRGWEGVLRLWDKGQRELLSRPVLGETYPFSRAGARFGVVTGPGKFAVCDATAGKGYRLLQTALPPGDRGVSCDFSPDGKLLVSTDPNGIRLWNVQTERQIASVPRPRWDYSAAFHPNGSNLIVGTAQSLEDWSMARDLPGNPGTLEFQRNWDRSFATDRIYLSRDRRTLATGSATERALHVFDVESGREIQQLKPRYGSFLAALSADARLAATWVRNGTNLHVWDVARSNIVRELPTYSSTFVAFSPNNQWLVVGNEVEFRAWEMRTWRSLYALPREASGSYGYMAFSADSRLLALTISRSLVRLVEASTGRELATLEAPDRLNIAWLTFNAHGTRLAAASGPGAIQLWDLDLIRKQLAAMKLNWDLPSGPASSQEQPP